jgi:tryptophan synthase alpha chain
VGIERITAAFKPGKPLLSMWTAVGFPFRDSAPAVCESLVKGGAGMIELGIPYSDPLADGPTIQAVNAQALAHGAGVALCFEQLPAIRQAVGEVPILAMGYVNPMMQYGYERFLVELKEAGGDGIIIPDLPIPEYRRAVQPIIEDLGLGFIGLVTIDSSEERIRLIDSLSRGFVYAVSSRAVTGGQWAADPERLAFLGRLRGLGLKNPIMVGFGIDGREAFDAVAEHADGAIIASAFVKRLLEPSGASNASECAEAFVREVVG